jgi:flagellar hook-associated protein 3 FlgL
MTNMRVTEQSRQTAHVRYITMAQAKLDRIQETLSTSRRINRASDDPAGTALALRHREDIQFEKQMRRNVENGTAFMNISEAAMNGATDALQRIRELTVQAANDTLNAADRATVAQEIDQLTRHIAQVANTNFGGAYVFGGHQTDTPAYSVVGNPPTAITYQGDAGARTRRISKSDVVAVNVTGQQVFGSAFADLIQLRTDLAAGGPSSVLTAHLSEIDAALERLIAARADIGARTNRFEAVTAQSEQTDLNLEGLRSRIEEPDLAETIMQMQQQSQALEAALGAIGRTASMTLLNFLR